MLIPQVLFKEKNEELRYPEPALWPQQPGNSFPFPAYLAASPG